MTLNEFVKKLKRDRVSKARVFAGKDDKSTTHDPRLTGVFVELEAKARLRRQWAEWEARDRYNREIAELVKAQATAEAEWAPCREIRNDSISVSIKIDDLASCPFGNPWKLGGRTHQGDHDGTSS